MGLDLKPWFRNVMATYSGMLDTNTLLRILLDDNEQQVTKFWKFIEGKRPVFIPDMVFAEMVYILMGHYQYSRTEVAAAFFELIEDRGFVTNGAVLTKAISHFVKHPALSYADCYLAFLASEQDVPLYTFDKKLINQSAGLAKPITS